MNVSHGETAVHSPYVGSVSAQTPRAVSSSGAADESQVSTQNENVSATEPPTGSTSMAETFLTLFVAEIQNQDPTEPTDPTEYVTQLASMTQVVMAEDLSAQMANNSILMSNLQVMALGKMIGDDVMVQTSAVTVEEESEITGRVTLSSASTSVSLNFKDEAGNEYSVPLGEQAPGPVEFSINPTDYGIPAGDYQISVVTNTGEENVPVEIEGRVTDVRIPLDGSTPVLNVTGIGEVPFIMLSEFCSPIENASAA